MPAIVTTPANADAITLAPNAAIQPAVATATTRAPAPPAGQVANANVRHLVVAPPLRRWNGTTWVTQYVPRN